MKQMNTHFKTSRANSIVAARLPIAVLMGVLTASCAVGPNYRRPSVQVPSTYRGATISASDSLADREWFDLFRDDTLTSLVTTALQQNFELRIAAERVLQARAVYGISRSDQLPTVDATASATASRLSKRGASGTPPADAAADVRYMEAGFSFGWEMDVWGRLRRLTEAARAQYLASDEARRGVLTTLIADVAQNYLALRAFDAELEIAKRTRDVANDGLRLTEARREQGLASGLDVRQAEQLLYTATGRIASLEREGALAENALRLLLGQLPGDVPRGASLEAFQTPPAVPAGLPSALLERRPDIRAAEQQLVAATAQIGAAKADYFPRISLTGFFGAQSRALTDLLTGPAGLATAIVGAAAPVINRGRIRGNVQVAESLQREAAVNYERVIYTAFQDVSDSLATYGKTLEQRAEQERLVDALRESTRLSTQRYESGLDSYLPVLDAQRNLFEGELDLTGLRQRELTAIVQLYRALGGGWSPPEAPPTN
jgi:NodT family efflux transporter outer membrane factor (OMF) lipoprotein